MSGQRPSLSQGIVPAIHRQYWAKGNIGQRPSLKQGAMTNTQRIKRGVVAETSEGDRCKGHCQASRCNRKGRCPRRQAQVARVPRQYQDKRMSGRGARCEKHTLASRRRKCSDSGEVSSREERPESGGYSGWSRTVRANRMKPFAIVQHPKAIPRGGARGGTCAWPANHGDVKWAAPQLGTAACPKDKEVGQANTRRR